MTQTIIQYDDGTLEALTDSEPGIASPAVGSRSWMPKQCQCASHGWYTVIAVLPLA